MMTGAAVASNPVAVGGGTAFLVAFAFVSANALWYQPHRHAGAFISTRLVEARDAANEPTATTIRIAREADVAPLPKPDPLVKKVQSALAGLNLYGGAVDGLTGPRTRAAIEDYQRIAGLEPSGEIGPDMLKRLGIETAERLARSEPPAAVPSPRMPSDRTASVATPDPVIVQIQAGLRAFGNDGIELDGVAGLKTKAAIREFQSLFGLTVNGEPDAALLAKMKDVGLVN